MARHGTPAGHYTYLAPPDTKIETRHDAYTQEEVNRTSPPPPHQPQTSTTSPEPWSHRERVRSTSFPLPLPANMKPRTYSYHPRSPDGLAPRIVDTFGSFPCSEVSRSRRAKPPTSSPRGSDSALQSFREGFRNEGNRHSHGRVEYSRYHDLHRSAPKDPYYFVPTTPPSLVPSGDGSHRYNLSDTPRAVFGVYRLSTIQRPDGTEYTRESSSDKPNGLQLPPISFLLSLSMTEATNVLQRHTNESDGDGLRMPFETQRNEGNSQPGKNNSQVLPPPRLLEPSSAAGYSKPAGAMLRPRCTPISICKANLESGSSLCHYSSTHVQRPLSDFTEDRNYISEASEERQYPNTRPGMRHGLRQTMSEAEKRARKALQQQRRRKHGPTREPRERFSEEEDTWLVMEKRRLEKEPNKHWTDLEYAHKAKFPNLKDRTLSGLQSRYYRIKKKYPTDPASPGGNGAPSRWDAEVEGHFSEGADSDGEVEDFEMRDASVEGDSSGSGAERV
ncbi:hypothetical protein BGX38DRAFT_1142403 [Terfezia claveryi]|nr:hypothetical protein BGX38DRAFT_1142403 [Terfezia claveryi]